MNRIATILFLLAVVFLSTLDAQNITLQPLAGQMNCGVRVPGLPRQGFNLGLPETIGSSEGMILNFPEVTIQWEGPDASGIVRHAWLSSGKIEYTLVLTPGSDYVDAVMTVRNLTRAGWTNVFSFNCLNPTGADQFKDWTLERTYMSKNGKPFRMDGTTRVNDGSMSTVQFYLNNNYGPVSPFIQGFKATSPDQTDDSYIVTMSQDGTSYMAATSPRSCYLFDNLDRCCIHSAADFGDIPAGEEKTVTSRFYFAHGSLDDFITRFEAEVKHVQPPRKEKPLVAMCYGNPWVLADTTQWSAVLGKLDILKIYIGDISARLDSQQSRALANALLSHNIKIAVELGGLLDWHASKGDQSAAASFQQDFSNVRPLIDLIKSIDPTRSIDMLDMDGPIRRMLFPSNSAPTNHTLASAVTELSKVVKMWRDSVPGIEINLLTNFPNWAWGSTPSYFAINGRSDGYGRYEDVLDAVEAEKAKSGLYFDGLTVDNPYDYATGKAQTNQPGLIAGVDWMQRLAELDSRAKAMGLKVNMIFNTNGGRTAEGYSDQTLALIDLYHQRVGTPDGYWIQSWYQLPGEWLPESDAYTMTNIVREAMRKIAPQITASGYWGLRNIEMTLPGATFTELNPQYVAWGFVWDRVERPDNTFSWAGLDQAVDFTAQYGARTVFLLTPASSWASDGEARAPNDLDRAIPISDPVPERGYSEALYDYAYNLIDHAAKRNPDVLGYLRYGNEPQYLDHWITTEQTYRQDVDDYIRCLRTAYLAAHKAAADNNAEIKVSHGGFYYYSQLERSWFEYGEAHPEAQDSLVTLFNSHYERQWPLPISSWNDFSRRIQNTTGIPPTYWMDAIAGQTDWLDWFDIHYHFKPRYIFDNMKAFEASVSDSGGTLKPWLAAEAAMQIEAQGETRYEERFHAGDMVRKWIFGMAAGLKGICTPIVGAPPDRFFGLYSDQGDRYMSADAYAFVHSLIQPAAPPIDLSEQGAAAYRFKENSIVDVVWFDALFDTETDVVSYTPVVPEEFANRKTGDLKLQVYDILGLHLATLDVDQAPVIVPISQEPRVLIWQLAAVVDTSLALLEPADGRVYHGMQTMTFEPAGNDPVAGYLSILNGEDIQPAVRGMFFSIPGTRGTALSLRQLGEFYRSADSIGFIPELSLFLVSDIATDSVIAVSNQYDAVIDSIVTLSIAYGKAMFLRIGGEFNGVGEGWNGGGYHPYLYVDMFRKITDKFASRGFRDSVATIWCYYPAAANDFDSTDSRGALWYPGDDYVDWFGLDLFDPQDFDMSLPDYDRRGITRKGKSERFLAMARSKGKPVYMSETSAKGMNISADAADSQADWNEWFAKFFEFITAHQEIKGYSYIDANWPEHAYAGWGDARIENSPDISAWYRDEMHKPKYIHLPATGPTGVTDANPAASSIILHGNYPNPFNPSTTIRFELPRSMQVTLVISDALGRDVRRVINGEIYAAGEHTAVFDARTLPSGVYNYRLVADGAVKIRRMLLLR